MWELCKFTRELSEEEGYKSPRNFHDGILFSFLKMGKFEEEKGNRKVFVIKARFGMMSEVGMAENVED